MCVCVIFINHLFTDRYWSCFHVLAIVNSASMNIRVHIYLRNTDCTSSECTPRSVIIGLYKNYKTLMKKIEDPCRWKVILCSCFGRVNVIYLCFFSLNIHTTQRNLQIHYDTNENFRHIFHRKRGKNPKICMELQKTLNSQRNLLYKNKAVGITLPDFKSQCKPIVIKQHSFAIKT